MATSTMTTKAWLYSYLLWASPYRQELASYTHGFNQLARAALLCLFMWWLLKVHSK